MAQRRMFSKGVIATRAFLEMPISSQLLYFHLGMEADDDGFVDPFSTMRVINCNEDDLKVLKAKQFVIPFESGVVVIRQWKENNFIRNDRYRETIYMAEKSKLSVDTNGWYTNGIPLVDAGKDRLGKVRLGKVSNTTEASSARFNPLGSEIIKAFEVVDPKNKTYYGNTTQRKACDYLLGEFSLEEILARIKVLPQTNSQPYFPKINSPYELKEKWVKLEDTVKSKKIEITKKENFI